MDWINTVSLAVEYIEENISEDLTLENVAKSTYSSTFHFQRVFCLMCGFTLGEYIKRRRLTLAGEELSKGEKVLTVAVRYGYSTSESFSRAFFRFHGVLPSEVRKGKKFKTLPKLALTNNFYGDESMNYKIENRQEITLVGFKKRFYGVPYGEERARQEEEFARTTRAKQWLLLGASCDHSTDYCVITNVNENGYDFYFAWNLDEWTRTELFNPQTTGVDFIDKLGFEAIIVKGGTYATFSTPKMKRPIADYVKIRDRIIKERVNFLGYEFANAPELIVMHWRPQGEWEKERYIEICLPLEKVE